MVTGPVYDASGGHPALDFANSMDRSVGKPWVERLGSFEDLLTWSAGAGTLGPDELARVRSLARRNPSEAEAVLERARVVREAIQRLFTPGSRRSAEIAADLEVLNAELARALARTRVAASDGSFAFVQEPELDQPLWPVVRAAAELLVSPERALVRRCASPTCLWLFLDRTKNHRRRWCDMKVCGNRAKVRQHRLRARSRPGS